jgi:hypothetical protein
MLKVGFSEPLNLRKGQIWWPFHLTAWSWCTLLFSSSVVISDQKKQYSIWRIESDSNQNRFKFKGIVSRGFAYKNIMLISRSSVFSFSRTVSVFTITTVSFRAVLSQDSSPQLSGPPVLASCYVLIVLARLSCPECPDLAVLSRLYFVVLTLLNCVDF